MLYQYQYYIPDNGITVNYCNRLMPALDVYLVAIFKTKKNKLW